MAIDGSFNLKLALETFSERCPKVAAFPFFNSILSKGEEVVDNEEVINVLSDVFLHPELTIPLVHYFLPIIRRVVDRVVGLLHLVGDLSSSSDYSDDVSVLEDALKEGSCSSSEHVLARKAPPPYERILVKEIISESQMEATTAAYLLCLQVSYRFLVIRPEVFSKLWDWSCYLESMKKLSDCPSQRRDFVEKHREAVWCGIQILSVVLRCTDRMAGCYGFEGEEAFSYLLRWEEFCQDIEIEKAGSYIQLPTYKGLRSFQDFSTLAPGIHKQQSAGVGEREPLMKIRRLDTCQKRPVLLYGPSGSGKSALIRRLADESGNQVVFIHMDDQLDGKTLVGTYVCTDQPGEFKWQPGSLTQ
ncbi:hypothetical protein Bca52824_052272, partial [Brassica carinata]